MPVWHETVKQWVTDGELVLLGITQEQHPDRCQLFAQWKGLDFPIMWDPFNLTGAKVVPNFIAIDEHGIVRSIRPNPRTFEDEFLRASFEKPAEADKQRTHFGACSFSNSHHFVSPISSLTQQHDIDESVTSLQKLSAEHPDDAGAAFRAGVALRLRYDSPQHKPGDFQAAVDAWTHALQIDPNQYIWRRRIQQYGPRMDKPYPFYSWTEQAQCEIRERGDEPTALLVELTRAELAEPRESVALNTPPGAPPDPDGKIDRDRAQLVAIDTTVAFDTSQEKLVASVHIGLRPDEERDTHWNHEAGAPLQIWVGGEHPEFFEVPPSAESATSNEMQLFNFEVELGEDESSRTLPAYALYYVCEGESGKCLYLRQDFEIDVVRP